MKDKSTLLAKKINNAPAKQAPWTRAKTTKTTEKKERRPTQIGLKLFSKSALSLSSVICLSFQFRYREWTRQSIRFLLTGGHDGARVDRPDRRDGGLGRGNRSRRRRRHAAARRRAQRRGLSDGDDGRDRWPRAGGGATAGSHAESSRRHDVS